VDFTCGTNETLGVRTSRLTSVFSAAVGQRVARAAVCLSLVSLGACERIKQRLAQESGGGGGDAAWAADSAFLAPNPPTVFRVIQGPQGRLAVPMGTMGALGFHRIQLTPRGWRAFDGQYLHGGNALSPVATGLAVGSAPMSRGYWEAGNTLDSLPGCKVPVPAGVIDLKSNATLAVAHATPKLKPVETASDAAVQSALSAIPTLIAPTNGISVAMLATYRRQIYVLPTGATKSSSILVLYDDPQVASDTLAPMTQRPRQLVVVLDKSVYGYRPSYTFTTVGNALSAPRLRFLDMLDVDNDGTAELFFGFTFGQSFDGTFVLRYENDAWREMLREALRCQR
jgi:hypothetical protein